jgi:hypothetical protein
MMGAFVWVVLEGRCHGRIRYEANPWRNARFREVNSPGLDDSAQFFSLSNNRQKHPFILSSCTIRWGGAQNVPVLGVQFHLKTVNSSDSVVICFQQGVTDCQWLVGCSTSHTHLQHASLPFEEPAEHSFLVAMSYRKPPPIDMDTGTPADDAAERRFARAGRQVIQQTVAQHPARMTPHLAIKSRILQVRSSIHQRSTATLLSNPAASVHALFQAMVAKRAIHMCVHPRGSRMQ